MVAQQRILSGVAVAFVLGLSLAATPPAIAAPPPVDPVPGSWTLKGVVMYARHGIRAPTKAIICKDDKDENCQNAVSQRKWPSFGVAAGNLLPQGYERVRTLGRYFRAFYAKEGLAPEKGCPAASYAMRAYGDDERTVMTAGALADGLFPDCKVRVSLDSNIFSAPDTCEPDSEKSDAEALKLIGGSWKALAEGRLKKPLKVMNEVVGEFQPAGCSYYGTTAPCSISSFKATKTSTGGISVSSTPSELFLFEYAAGFPARDVAWGKLAKAAGTSLSEAVSLVNELHAIYFRAFNMPVYQARLEGSQSLNLLFEKMAAVIAAGEADTRIYTYVGHDNSILNVAGLLGLEWQLKSYPAFQVPPGSVMAFEVWERKDGTPMIRAVYYSQTIRQLRANTPLDLKTPPASVVMPIKGCKGTAGACPWEKFQAIAEAAIDPACVAKR